MTSPSMQTPHRRHVAAVNGIQMVYETYGEGDPLVLLHGFTQTAQFWQPFVAGLAAHYRLIIPDLRGHGRSTGPVVKLMARQAASDLFALLDGLAIDRCKAAGVSYGGSILLHMATQQPDRIEAMVLVGATPYFPEQARAFYGQISLEGEGWDWDGLRQRHVHGDEQIRALLHHLHGLKDSVDDMNLTADSLATIQAKTLIVAGDRDHVFPVSIAVEMVTAIPQSYLWIVPNGTHVPIVGERAPLFTQTTLDFFSGQWDAKAT